MKCDASSSGGHDDHRDYDDNDDDDDDDVIVFPCGGFWDVCRWRVMKCDASSSANHHKNHPAQLPPLAFSYFSTNSLLFVSNLSKRTFCQVSSFP